MPLWNIVDNFDSDLETVNFGTRNFALSGKTIYECVTLATIKPDDAVLTEPKISGLSHRTHLFLTIDNTLTVLNAEDCCQHEFSIAFPTMIDCFTVLAEGEVVILCLQDGSIIGLHTGQGLPIFNILIEDTSTPRDGVCFIGIIPYHDYCIAVCTTGQAYKISYADEKTVKDAVYSGNDQLLADLQDNANVCKVECKVLPKYPVHSAVMLPGNEISADNNDTTPTLLMVGREIYSVCGIDIERILLDDSISHFVKVQQFQNGTKIICLSNSGSLYFLCPYTLTVFPIRLDMVVRDFILIPSLGPNEPDGLLVLSELTTNGTRDLGLVDFPNMEYKYRLPVADKTTLINVVGLDLELNFLEIFKEPMPSHVTEIRVKYLHESDPKFRLRRFIKSGQFAEAEVFAKRFNMPMDIVYQARATKLLRDFISSQSNTNVCNGHGAFYEIFIELMDLVKDKFFIVNCCLEAVGSTSEYLDITRKLLHYTMERIAGDSNMKDQVCVIQNTLSRLDTYELIRDEIDCVLSWEEFHSCDMYAVCLEQVNRDNFTTASSIWTRHFPSIKPRLNTESVSDMLTAISSDLHPVDIMPWLRHFIPEVLAAVPDSFGNLVNWAYNTIVRLERTQPTYWPQVGMDCTEAFLELLVINYTGSSCVMDMTYDYRLSVILDLKKDLTDLIVLKDKYMVRLPLNNYKQETISDLALVVLERVSTENLPLLQNEFIGPRVITQGFQPDDVIKKYIDRQLDVCKLLSSERMATLVGCLKGEQVRMECTLAVLKAAPIPWDDAMEALASCALATDHCIAADILSEQRHIGYRLIMVKYNYMSTISVWDVEDYLIPRIIKESRPEMMEDIRKLVETEPSLGKSAYFQCLLNLFSKGSSAKALEIMDSLNRNLQIELCEKFLVYPKGILNFQKGPIPDRYMIFFEILKPIYDRLVKLGGTYFDYNEVQLMINMLKARNEFHVDFNLRNNVECLNEGISQIVEQVKSTLCEDKEVCSKAGALANVLDMSRTTGLTELTKQANLSQLTVHVAEVVSSQEFPDSKTSANFGKLAAQLIQQAGSCNESCEQGDSKLELCHMERAIPVALQLVGQACAISEVPCKAGVYCQCQGLLQIHDWAALASQVFGVPGIQPHIYGGGEGHFPSLLRLSNMYEDPPNATENQQVLACIALAVQTVCSYYADNKMSSLQFLESSVNIVPLAELPSLIRTLRASLKKLVQREYMVWQIAQKIYNYSICLPEIKEVGPIISLVLLNKYAENCIKKMITHRKFDLQGAMSVIGSCGPQMAFIKRIMKESCHDVIRLSNASLLGSEYLTCTAGSCGVEYVKMMDMKKRCYWMLKLSELNLSYKDALTVPSDNWPKVVLKNLLSKPGNLSLLKKYCFDCHTDYQEMLVMQIIVLLNNCEPHFKIATDCYGKEEVVMLASEKDLLNKFHDIVDIIEDKAMVVARLKQFIMEIDFYHYELYLCVLSMLTSLNSTDGYETWQSLLQFLTGYQRITPPAQAEDENYLTTFSKSNLPAIAMYRLPFMALVRNDPWDTIKPELNLTTCKSWFLVAECLPLEVTLEASKNKLCSRAIKNTVMSMYNSSDRSWSFYPKQDAVRKSCMHILSYVTGHELRAALLIFITNYSAKGADQIAAAKECYNYVLECENAGTPLKPVQANKMKLRYPLYATTHVLHKQNLAEWELLKLAETPKDLILALFNHPSVLERAKGHNTEALPDIIKAVQEIALLHPEILWSRIQMDLCSRWLEPPVMTTAVDDTFSMSFILTDGAKDEHGIWDDNLIKACYFLKSWDLREAIMFLRAISKEDSESTTTGLRLRALQCMLAIANPEDVSSVTDNSVEEIMSNMKIMSLIWQLESIGLSYTEYTFEKCNKIKLVQSVLRSHKCNIAALVLTSQLCRDYDITEPNIWNDILSAMIDMDLIGDLKRALSWVTLRPALCSMTSVIDSWQQVLKTPFVVADRIRQPDQEKECVGSLLLLQRCPVARKLDLISFAQYCLNAHRPYMAAAVLPLADPTQVSVIKKMIRSQANSSQLEEDLLSLEEMGVLYTKKALQILNC